MGIKEEQEELYVYRFKYNKVMGSISMTPVFVCSIYLVSAIKTTRH